MQAVNARRKRILYVESSVGGVGGSMHSLRTLLRYLDRRRFEPLILVFEDKRFWHDMRVEGTPVECWSDAGRDRLGMVSLALAKLRPAGGAGVGTGQASVESTVPVSKQYRGQPATWRAFTSLFRLCVRDLPLAWRLAQLARERGADLLHANDRTGSNRFVTVAGLLAGLPVVQHERLVAPYRWTDGAVSRWTDVTVCVSCAVAEQVRNNGNRCGRIQVVPNAVESLGASLARRNGSRRVGVFGRVTGWKGQDLFLNAMSRVVSRWPNTRFVVAGGVPPGSESFDARLRKIASIPPLAGRVTFTGHLEDPYTVMAELDVLVVSTITTEPFGRTIIEAMSLGVPVVAPDAGGPAEIIEDGVNGFLYPPGDAERLGEAVEALLSDAELAQRLASRARKDALQRYSPEAHADSIQLIYQRLLDGRL